MSDEVGFLKSIVKEIVTKPGKVEVKKTLDEMGVLFEIRAEKEDRAILIGKKGQNINAIRQIFRILGAKNRARYNIKIMED